MAERRSCCSEKRSRGGDPSRARRSGHVPPILLGAIERGIGIGEKRDGIVGIVVRIERRCRCSGRSGSAARGYRRASAIACEQAARQAPSAVSGCSPVCETSVNSSPPTRAMKAPAAAASSRCATAQRSSSPTAWPKTSLASLKWSRSIGENGEARAGSLGAARTSRSGARRARCGLEDRSAHHDARDARCIRGGRGAPRVPCACSRALRRARGRRP